MNDALEVGVESLKLARVSGLEATEATNAMTSA